MRPSLFDLAALNLPEPAPQVRESVLDASEELDALTTKALKNLSQILDEPMDFENPKLINQKLQASQQVLNTQVRVDESRLKKKMADALPRLLEIIAREEGRSNAARLIEGTLAN